MRKEAHSVSTPRIVEKFTNARLLKKTKFYELLAKFESEWGPNPTTRPHGLIIMQKLIDLKKCDFAPDLNELNRMIISSFLSVFWTELEAFIRLPRPKLVTVVEGATDISPVVLPPVFDGTGDVLDDEFLVKSAEKMARVLSKTRRIKVHIYLMIEICYLILTFLLISRLIRCLRNFLKSRVRPHKKKPSANSLVLSD